MIRTLEIEIEEGNISKDKLLCLGATPLKFHDYFSLEVKKEVLIYAPIGDGKYYLRNTFEKKEKN